MPLTAILVEDSPTIRENLVAALTELVDVEVVAVAESPAQAMVAFDQFKDSWDLAVVDLFLKEGSGMTILRACRDRPSNRHMLVLTNYPTPEIRRRCLELGADAVFDKSTELDAFFAKCADYAKGL